MKKVVMLDTNAVIHFITNDDPERSLKVVDLLDKERCLVSIEVIAETAYTLEKRYNHDRQTIANEIKDLIGIKEDLVSEENVVRYGCNLFASTRLDFVDCLLVGYANVKGNPVFTFDGVLRKKLEHMAYNG